MTAGRAARSWLHPQARAALAAAAHREQPAGASPTGFDVAALRADDRATAARPLGHDEDVAHVTEVDADGVRCRLYRPAPGAPVAVHLHGGAWLMGDLDTRDVLCRHLARQSGWAVLAVDYRLAPEHPYPAALEDAGRAVAWLRGHGREHGLDPDAVALVGDSAGANLAAGLALRNRDRAGPAFLLQVLVYPLTDLVDESPSRVALGSGFGLTDDFLRWAVDRYLPRPADRRRADASPLRAASLRGLPPALVITAEYDPLRDEGEGYAAALAAAGVPVIATRYLGMIHGFWADPARFDASRQAISQVAAALRTVSRPGRAHVWADPSPQLRVRMAT